MKCAFYRPEEINVEEFNNIVNGLKKDLAAMESGRVTKEEPIQYDYSGAAEPPVRTLRATCPDVRSHLGF